ncbi:MAG: hypothetical protein ACK5MZ_07770 [Aestuariibaculum sp.]
MKLLVFKVLLYAVLIAISLEVIVRFFHLYDEYPHFIINDKNVKTYAPSQNGYAVKGNRLMNFAEYHINNSGFNSYREFTPTKNGTDVAIIGDSFIEGFHQNYYNSIGRKIENKLGNNIPVFEYGHSGYDFADQLHLINAYKDKFELIDYIFIYLKFENDLKRNSYQPDQYWIDSQYFLTSRIERKVKLFNYLDNMGLTEPFKEIKRDIVSAFAPTSNKQTDSTEAVVLQKTNHSTYLKNFKTLVNTYGFNKNKTVIVLDSRYTSTSFLNYCDSVNYKYLDFGMAFEKSKTPTTLIYDMHWNNHGRNMVANVIANYIKQEETLKTESK